MAKNPNAELDHKVRDRRDRADRGFVVSWILATSVGLVVGGVAAASVNAAVRQSLYGVAPDSDEILKSIINVGTILCVWGAFIGTTQWTVLRRRLHRAGWWTPATAAGWGLAGAFAGSLSALFSVRTNGSDVTSVGVAASFIPFILLPGLIQFLGLRNRVEAAASWLWGSVGAFILGGVGAFAIVRGAMVSAGWLTPYDFPSAKVFVLFGVVMGPIYGAVTGLVMVRLLRRQGTM